MINKIVNPLRDPIYGDLFKIAIPVALQNLVISSLSFVDTLMIGQLGEVEIAAVGIGNQLFFLYTLLLFGIGSASSIFASQFWGKKDVLNIRHTSGLGVMLGLIGALPFTFFSLLIPETLVGIFSTDPQVIELGSEYIRIVAVSYLFSAIVITMSQVQRSLERANLPFIVSVCALGLNTFLNYLLIFGKAGFPALGVKGAALATAFARGVECILLILIIYNSKENPAAGRFRDLFGFSAGFMKRFMKTASPVIINEFFWALGMTVFKIVFGRMGTSALASVNIAEAVMNLMFVALMGSATGTSVLTGKKIGEGDYTGAKNNGRKFIQLAITEAVIIAVVCALLSGLLPRGFNVPEEIKRSASRIILIFAVFLPFKSFNLHTIVGVFRGGGDTLFAAIAEISGVWCVGVVLALFTGIRLGLPIHIVYAFISLEEVSKTILCAWRLRSGKWVHDLT